MPTTDDRRANLAAGFENPGTAELGVDHLANRLKPAGFFDPANPGNFGFADLRPRVRGRPRVRRQLQRVQRLRHLRPANPTLATGVVCPGGQGDMSVYGNLLFMSVEETRARVDCGTDPTVGTRFQGVRIFDISDVANPVQVAAVQTCRGSHTHSLVDDPDDPDNVYIYVSGTAGVRPATTLAGCNNNPASRREPVPVADRGHQGAARRARRTRPSSASRGCSPTRRPARSTACRTSRRRRMHPSGIPWGPTPITDACHDITVYPESGSPPAPARATAS